MLAHWSPRRLALVSVASTKVGTESTRPRSCRTSKKSIFRAALCRVTYLFCARVVQPAKTWATLLGALLHSLHITSPVVSVCVFFIIIKLLLLFIIIIIIIIIITSETGK